MPKQTIPISMTSVERDPRLFTGFLTLVMGIMYIVALLERPALRAPLSLAIFTTLLIIHVFLHWQIERIVEKNKLLLIYILVQGILGFSICWMAQHEAFTFAIYMALFGEAVGMLGLTRRTLLAVVYLLGLAFINLQSVTTIPLALLAVTTLPILLFVSIYVILYLRQSEAREQAQILAAELEVANQQLSEYAAQVEDLTIAAERQRLARELHDTLSQGLAGLILQLEAADAYLNQNRPEKAHQIISQAMQKAREALTDSRSAISNLRENNLGELIQAVRSEVERFEAATGITCAFQAEQIPPQQDSFNETILRSISEALTNIARHAQASETAVTLSTNHTLRGEDSGEVEAQTIMVTITDNGIGFDPQNLPSGHYGILGIRERIRLIGGQFTLDSTPGKGTTLTVQIPLKGQTPKATS